MKKEKTTDSDLDIVWEYERLRRRVSYEYALRDVGVVRGSEKSAKIWNDSKIKDWARKFREKTEL